MVRVTDCDRGAAQPCSSGMPDFASLRTRIDALCAQCASPDARLIAEMEELLAEGYVCALKGDHLSRRLRARLDALTDAGAPSEALRPLAQEQRAIAEATRELRAQLAVMQRQWVALGSERLGLT
jgi:hypothetical protein